MFGFVYFSYIRCYYSLQKKKTNIYELLIISDEKIVSYDIFFYFQFCHETYNI